MPRVELHGYTPDGAAAGFYRSHDIDRITDLTPFVLSLSWTHSVKPPWETITLTCEIPVRYWSSIIPGEPIPAEQKGGKTTRSRQPRTGFWVVVKVPTAKGYKAVAWGRAVTLAVGVGVGGQKSPGGLKTARTTIVCASWLSLLQNSRLLLSPGMPSEVEGFIYRLQNWGPVLSELMKIFGSKYPGEMFTRLWAKLVRIWLPPTLGGEVAFASDGSTGADFSTLPLTGGGKPLFIGDEIPVVHNEETADQFCPARKDQIRPVVGWAINATGSRIPSGSMWDVFASTFIADPNLVELFPSLEDSDSGGMALPKTLGTQPVLIYRLKPYLLDPIDKATAQRVAPGAREPSAQTAGLFQDPINRTPGKAGGYASDWYTWTTTEITNWRLRWEDSERVNATTVRTPVQPRTAAATHGVLGTPVYDPEDVQKHGLRFYEGEWPFFPTSPSESDTSTLADNLDALIEFAWVCVGESHVFAVGEFTGVYKPRVRAGHWIVIDFPTPGSKEDEGAPEDLDHWPFYRFNAYIESVTHTVDLADPDTGVVRGRTTVSFARGSSGEDGNPISPVPVRERAGSLADIAEE